MNLISFFRGGTCMLYKELLESSRPHLLEFFKNAKLFDNQFCWNDYNQQCYDYFYVNNSYDELSTVKGAKETIPDMKEMCKKCGKYFIPQRNKSIPKYDLMAGQQFENELMIFLQEKLDTKVENGDSKNKSYPDLKVLKKDGTVAAYLEVKYHAAPFVLAKGITGRECYEGSVTLDYKKIKKQLELIDTQISAPVYYIHWIDYPCLKGIFYETADAVKSHMEQQHAEFERKKREGDDQKAAKSQYFAKIYSYLLTLRSFEEMMDELKSLLVEK